MGAWTVVKGRRFGLWLGEHHPGLPGEATGYGSAYTVSENPSLSRAWAGGGVFQIGGRLRCQALAISAHKRKFPTAHVPQKANSWYN